MTSATFKEQRCAWCLCVEGGQQASKSLQGVFVLFFGWWLVGCVCVVEAAVVVVGWGPQ